MVRILVVDDEPDIREILTFNLEAEGYAVAAAASAEEALTLMAASRYDLLLLDVMMEHMSGFELARRLRAEGNMVPVIFLTALADEPSQLEGFGSGADDYVAKPFSFSTVLARVKAVLRRCEAPAHAHDGALVLGPLAIDTQHGTATLNGAPIELTRKELQILQLLVSTQGTYHSRDEIMQRVWGAEVCVGDRSVDVHIARLRKKLGPVAHMLQAKTGFGYRMVHAIK